MDSISLTSGYEANPMTSSPNYANGVRVNLPDISALECLPSSGSITFKFKRDDLRLSRDSKLSATLILTDIEDVKCDEEAEDEPLSDAVDKLFEEAKKEDGETEAG